MRSASQYVGERIAGVCPPSNALIACSSKASNCSRTSGGSGRGCVAGDRTYLLSRSGHAEVEALARTVSLRHTRTVPGAVVTRDILHPGYLGQAREASVRYETS